MAYPYPGSAGHSYPGAYGHHSSHNVDPEIYQWFIAVDSDRSGKISAKELQQALVNGNWSHFSEESCRMMISMFDKDNSGTIELTEFQGLWNYIKQWKAVFQRYDTNRTGSVDIEELTKAVTDMGYRLSPQFAINVISRFGSKPENNITLDTFIVLCVQLRLLTDAFRVRDKDMTGVITIGYEDFINVALMNKP